MQGIYSSHTPTASTSATVQRPHTPSRAIPGASSSSHQMQQPKQHLFKLDDEALPPPHRDTPKQQKQRTAHPPPLIKVNAVVPSPQGRASTSFLGGVGVLDDDDETEDEDDDVKFSRESKPVVVVPQPVVRKSHPAPVIVKAAKVKLTLAPTAPTLPSRILAPRTRMAPNPYASAKPISPPQPRRISSPPIFLEDSEDSDGRPLKRQKSHKASNPLKRAIGVATSEISSKSKKRTKAIGKKEQDRADSSAFVTTGNGTRKVSSSSASRAPPRPIPTSVSPKKVIPSPRSLPTPSRSSLRQVLAASVREVTVSRDNSPALSWKEDRKSFGHEQGDDDLSDLDSDSEEDLERAEERALIAEFEKGNNSRSGPGDSSDDDDLTDLSEDDHDEGWQERERERAEDRLRTTADSLAVLPNFYSHREASIGADAEGSLELEDDDLDLSAVVNDIPETGGRGVVTWSDYDSVENSDVDLEDTLGGDFGEFEDELEELLALSEAVVGPVREDEYELGEMWFEEISDQADDESGSAEDSGPEEDADETVLGGQGWGKSSAGSISSGSTDSDDTEGYENYDEEDGDTTDSLDSDDHVGLIRFGIEVDSDSTLDGSSDEAGEVLYRHAPGTASLADVMAPTSADLAVLPQYLFSSFTRDGAAVGMMLDLQGLEDDPEAAITQTADGLGVGRDTAAGILANVNRSLGKGKGRARDLLEVEDDTGAESEGTVGGPPAMGSFMRQDKGKGRGTEISLVIDGSDTIAPSPFSKIKKSKKRPRELLESGTPSRRPRANSKVSTASGRSVTDGSISGEVPDVFSPQIPFETMDLELDDLLASSDTEEEEGLDVGILMGDTPGMSGLSDLSRWNRVPIGAFRTSTMPTFSPTRHYYNASAEELVTGYSGRRTSSGTLAVPVTHPGLRGSRTNSSSLSHTLSPYTAGDNAANVARMITSPLLRPVRDPAESASPPKLRQKERKSIGSSGQRLSAPKPPYSRSPSATSMHQRSSPLVGASPSLLSAPESLYRGLPFVSPLSLD